MGTAVDLDGDEPRWNTTSQSAGAPWDVRVDRGIVTAEHGTDATLVTVGGDGICAAARGNQTVSVNDLAAGTHVCVRTDDDRVALMRVTKVLRSGSTVTGIQFAVSIWSRNGES